MIQYTFLKNKGFSQEDQKLVRLFDSYLENAENKEIVVFTSNNTDDDNSEIHIPYTHRWSPAYKKKMITQMYGVEEYIKRHNKSSIITLLTLTGYQDGNASIKHIGTTTSRTELFTKIKTGWRHLSNILAKICPTIEYLWIIEPHKSGYPHIHIALFGYIPKKIQTRLINLWSQKYNIGSKKHGINFQIASIKESIKSIKNYLLKYITKSIGANGRKSWSPEEFLYHAIAWKHKHRYIGMSQAISRYCTARKLRYRFAHHLVDLCGQFIQLPPLSTDKNKLKNAIIQYKQLPGTDPPNQNEQKWHYSFCITQGTLYLIHKKPTQSTTIINNINNRLAQILQYKDTFIHTQ